MANTTARERVEKELDELHKKTKSLETFIHYNSKFGELKFEAQQDLLLQYHAMYIYVKTLERRLKNWED